MSLLASDHYGPEEKRTETFHKFLSAISRHATRQAIKSRRRYQDIIVDVHKIIPSPAVRRAADRHAFLHIRRHRHAGEF